MAAKKTTKKTARKKVAKKKADPFFKFKDIKSSELILKWMGINKTNPKCKTPYFWSRETKMLKNLCGKYPHEFIEKLVLPFEVDSLVVLESKFHKDYIKRKYLEYKYVPTKEYKMEKVGKTKIGARIKTKNKKNIKNFLNGKDNE
jgi:hypothetical protein